MRITTSTATGAALFAALLFTGCMQDDDAVVGADPADDLGAEELLPPPKVWNAKRAVLDAEQARRQGEVDRYVRDQLYRGYEIVETTQTYSGDLVDWVDARTVPGSEIEPPPPLDPADLAMPPGLELQRTELDEHPELRGPAGTIPFVRPSFPRYVEATAAASLEEYLADEQTAQKALFGLRRYAGYLTGNGIIGLDAFVNQNINQIEAGTFSLLELAASCQGASPDTTRELVGMTVSKDMANFNDATQRLRVEFLTAGSLSGNYVGGWDGLYLGLIAAAGRPYGPNIALTVGPQYESRFHIQNYGGNWWVSHNNNWLGYYPGWMFNLMPFQACTANYYGEVYDPTPSPWTWTDMGSGYFPVSGIGKAAHMRNPYYVLPDGTATWLTNAAAYFGPNFPECYQQSSVFSGAAPWNAYFLLGGSGYTIFGCH